MKKIVCILMAMVMLFSLAACGEKKEAEPSGGQEAQAPKNRLEEIKESRCVPEEVAEEVYLVLQQYNKQANT